MTGYIQQVSGLSILMIGVLNLSTTAFAEKVGQTQQPLTGQSSAIWPKPSIAVCWENPTTANATQRSWVHSAVQATWEKESLVRFTGWGKCANNSGGIRIQILDDGPHTKGLGRHLNGKKNGMVLNFTFKNWSTSCRKTLEFCIKSIGVHEFGHALGFSHEQNRADAPKECRKEAQGTTGDIFITPYDLKSVMNYCNPKWNGDGKLSSNDIAGLHKWYGKPGAAPTIHYVWFGTAPFCGGKASDCTSRGMTYVRSDNKGDGKACSTGHKVQCKYVATPKRFLWVGTAPACGGKPTDCTARGMKYVRSDKKGDGNLCLTGVKVLCESK